LDQGPEPRRQTLSTDPAPVKEAEPDVGLEFVDFAQLLFAQGALKQGIELVPDDAIDHENSEILEFRTPSGVLFY
jgi:hypothetical protein